MRDALNLMRRNKLSFISTALACLFTIILWPWTGRLPFALFIAAAALCAWQAGARSSLLTTALGAAILGVICLLLPATEFPNKAADYTSHLAMLVSVGLLAAYLSHARERGLNAVRHFHAALGGSRDAVIFTDAQGRVTRLNYSAQGLVGWHSLNAVEQPLGLVLQLRHEQTGQPMEDFAAGALLRRETLDLPADAVVVSTQGKETPVEGSIVSLVDSGGGILGVMVCLRDVTKRRHAENAARLREENIRAHLSASVRASEERAGALQADFDRQLKEQEQARSEAEQALHQAQAEFERRTAEQASTHQEEAGRLLQAQQDLEKQLTEAADRQKQAEEELRKSKESLEAQLPERAAERKQAEEQLRQMRADLQRQLAEQLASHKDEHASLLGELAQRKASEEELRSSSQGLQSQVDEVQQQLAARDATAEEHRKRAELLERLLEAGDAGIFVFDRDCRFTFWNAAMERITGWERARVLGKLAFAVFPGLEESGESRHFLDALEGKRVQAQSRVLSQDGSRGLLEQTYVPIQEKSSGANGGAVFVCEITAPVRLNGKPDEEEHSQETGEVAGASTAINDNGFASSLFRADWDWLSFN